MNEHRVSSFLKGWGSIFGDMDSIAVVCDDYPVPPDPDFFPEFSRDHHHIPQACLPSIRAAIALAGAGSLKTLVCNEGAVSDLLGDFEEESSGRLRSSIYPDLQIITLPNIETARMYEI